MAKLNLLLFFGLLLTACSSENKDEQSILVTNIVMPASGTIFKPGDKVAISAQGFQEDDEIMFSIRWPLPHEPIQEGYAIGVRGIVIEKTATNITFLAPGHCPASTVEVLLRRTGSMMSLGKIAVADGQAPKDFQLYGIINSRSNVGRVHAIEHIDMAMGHVTEVTLLADNQDFSCVVNASGSWSLCGVWTQDGHRTTGLYDLSINYWMEQNYNSVITMGMATNNRVLAVYQSGDRLFVQTIGAMPYSRVYMPEKPDYGYQLPDGLKAEALSRYPCVEISDNNLLFSADNGDGTFSPVILNLTESQGGIHVCEPIQATALIPFWIMESNGIAGSAKRLGGYVVSKANKDTELRLLDQATMALNEPFTTFPNSACSVATLISENLNQQKLYVLFDTNRGGRLIYFYDLLNKEWHSLPGIDYPYSEIVLAR